MKEDLPSSVKPWKRWLTLVLICIGLIAGLAGLKYQQIQESIAFAASFPERSATVTAVTAKLGSANTHAAAAEASGNATHNDAGRAADEDR